MVAEPEESKMSFPELDPRVGGAWSHILLAAVIVIALGANDTRLFWVLQEITFSPALPAEPPPISPPATSYSTPKPAVTPGACPPSPTMLVGVLPPPLLVSSPISSTPAGKMIGKVSPLATL